LNKQYFARKDKSADNINVGDRIAVPYPKELLINMLNAQKEALSFFRMNTQATIKSLNNDYLNLKKWDMISDGLAEALISIYLMPAGALKSMKTIPSFAWSKVLEERISSIKGYARDYCRSQLGKEGEVAFTIIDEIVSRSLKIYSGDMSGGILLKPSEVRNLFILEGGDKLLGVEEGHERNIDQAINNASKIEFGMYRKYMIIQRQLNDSYYRIN